MRAMPEDDPKRPLESEEDRLRVEVAELRAAQGSPLVAAFAANAASAIRENGSRGALVERPVPHRIGPEHRHPTGEFAGRECYCDEPDAPDPAGATRRASRAATSASA